MKLQVADPPSGLLEIHDAGAIRHLNPLLMLEKNES